MLKMNCKKVIESRGIHDPKGHLRQNGFSYHKVYRLIGKDVRTISLDVLEKLCLTLNCTPNDLLEWTPNKGSYDTELTALRALKTGVKDADFNSLLSRLPFDKLSEIVKAVSETQKK